ncbi:NADH-quinone oxidoreductase subunit M [bacterium]|nr:NADH-quinone oxidoreductase subunit M [bacterium]NUN44889.1 NADH-quinone oxidoreductase subunit M [bacterium]
MENYNSLALSLLIFMPLVGVVVISFIDRRNENLIKATTFAFSALVFVLSIPIYMNYDFSNPEMQFTYKAKWIVDWGAYYTLGVDGLSMLLIMLTTFMMPLAVVASWKSIHFHVKGFMISLLLLDAGMVGVFCARDMLLFYVFWEAMLVPMYLIIGIWGHDHRIKAAVTFFIYTMAGSLFMLVAIIYMYFQTGAVVDNGTVLSMHSFAVDDFAKLQLPYETQYWLFLAFALAFAVKVPMFPFHTWLPLAHVEAPTAGSVDLAAILLKMGPYGFMRFCIPFFPEVANDFTPVIMVVAIIGIIYGALVAMVQTDAKKLVAYSSVSHLGFVMLGIFAFTIQGWQGAMMIMIGHGISTSALFLMIGMLYDRRHTREIAKFGGLWKVMPAFSVIFMIVCFSSLGLPGTNGFIGEFLVLIGTFISSIGHARLYATLAMLGVILGAVYLLWMYQRVCFGEIVHEENKKLPDLSVREYALVTPFLILIFLLGFYPKILTEKTEATMHKYLNNQKTAVEQAKTKKNSGPMMTNQPIPY